MEESPTKGDDTNPIENLWAILDERLESKKFTTEEGMKKAILNLWDEVDLSLLHNLIDSSAKNWEGRRKLNKSSELRFDGDAFIVKYSDPQKGG